MNHFIAMIIGWFIMMMVATGQQNNVKNDTTLVHVPISYVAHNNNEKKNYIDSKQKPSSSEDGYHKNRNIIVGVIIGVILIVMLLK